MSNPVGLPQYLIANYISKVQVTAVAKSGSTFTLSTNVTADLHASQILDGVTFTLRNEPEDITPIDVRMRNNVTVSSDLNFTVTEILSGAGVSWLQSAILAADYIRIYKEFTVPGAGAPLYCFCVIGRIGETTEALAKGKNVVEMTGDAAGINIYYGAASGVTI